MSIIQFLRYWLWDRWHSIRITDSQTERSIDPHAPMFYLGDLGISHRLFWSLLVAVLGGGIIYFLLNIGWISLATMQLNVELGKLYPLATCVARGTESGKLYAAYDCWQFQILRSRIVDLLIGLLTLGSIWWSGFVAGVLYAKKNKQTEV